MGNLQAHGRAMMFNGSEIKGGERYHREDEKEELLFQTGERAKQATACCTGTARRSKARGRYRLQQRKPDRGQPNITGDSHASRRTNGQPSNLPPGGEGKRITHKPSTNFCAVMRAWQIFSDDSQQHEGGKWRHDSRHAGKSCGEA